MNKGYLHIIGAALIIAPTYSYAVEPNTEMTIVYDSGGGDRLDSAVIDIEGNILLSGGRGNSSGVSSNSYFLAKYDSYGRELWNSTYETGSASWFGQSNAIDADRDGNTYMVLSESYHFGSIVKFDADGSATTLTQGTSVPSSWNHRVDIQLNDQGGLFLTLGNSVASHQVDGTLNWKSMFAGHYSSDVRDMLADASGNLYVVGQVWDSGMTGYNVAVVAKYDPAGSLLWEYRYRNSSYSDALGVQLDSTGAPVVMAMERNAAGNLDLMLKHFDPNGILVSSLSYDYLGNDIPKDFKLDDDDEMYVLIDSDNDYLTAKYAANGTELWTQRYDARRNDDPRVLDIDIEGGVHVTGGSSNYGSTSQQMLTIKYNPDGTLGWLKQQISGNGYGSFIQFGKTGETYVGGSTIASGAGDAVMYRYRLCP